MRVGDLVKLIPEAVEGRMRRPERDYERVGVITEWTAHDDGPLASGWVWWSGNFDWDIEYVEDLEVVSESR